MKYYKHAQTDEVFAYENEQERQEWGAPELVEMVPPEVEAHLNPQPVPEPATTFESVTRAQGKAALIQAGLWGAVESYVNGIEDPTEQALARVALDDTTEWRRDSPFLNAAAAALGLTEQQLDDLFVAAAAIVL